MWSAPLLPLLPGPLWPGVVAPDRVLSMVQIELNCVLMPNRSVLHLNCVLMLNWIVWNKTVYMYKNGFGIKEPTMIDMP